MLGGHLRLAEVVALRCSDIDLETGIVHITKAALELKGRRVDQRTKNGDHRHVALPSQVVELMREYLQNYPRLGMSPLFKSCAKPPDGKLWP